MNENNEKLKTEIIEDDIAENNIEEFKNIDESKLNEVEQPKVDLNKTTTKGLRVTERTKQRYNKAEKESSLNQEDFANRLLDMFDFFDGTDINKNPELIELTKIVNRIPEIFTNLLSKQNLIESSLASKHANQTEQLKKEYDDLKLKYEQLEENSKETHKELSAQFEQLKNQSDLKIREQALELDKNQKELTFKDEQVETLKENLEKTKKSFESEKTEKFEKLEKLNEQSDEINRLNKELQIARDSLLDVKQEILNLQKDIAESEQQSGMYKMKLENAESTLEKQKEMYEDQIKHYKELITTK